MRLIQLSLICSAALATAAVGVQARDVPSANQAAPAQKADAAAAETVDLTISGMT